MIQVRGLFGPYPGVGLVGAGRGYTFQVMDVVQIRPQPVVHLYSEIQQYIRGPWFPLTCLRLSALSS